jgi:receptor-type tyrosine-protein phosphatase Q
MAATLLVFAAFFQLLQLTTAQAVDRTLEAEASGSGVVRAVVNKIEAVFGDDDQFLRRIAYVESKDGTDARTYRNGYHGGIWQVDMIGFRDTQDVVSHPGLPAKFEQIMQEFGINWPNVEWMDLRKPLYSGIAARLKLSNVPTPIPCDVAGQAAYWKRHYNTELGSGTVQKFIDDVEALENKEGMILCMLWAGLYEAYLNTQVSGVREGSRRGAGGHRPSN